MGRICSVRWRQEKCAQNFDRKTCKDETTRKNLLRWEDNIRLDLKEIDIGWEGVDWIHVDQDRDQWQARVNTVLNPRDL